MKVVTNNYPYNRTTSKKLLKRYVLFMFILLPLSGVMIPSIMEYYSGLDHIKRFSNGAEMKENNKEIKMEEQPTNNVKPLTLAWITGSGSLMNQLNKYKDLKIVSPDFATINNQFNLQLIKQANISEKIHQQGIKVWSRVTMGTDTKTNVHTFLSNQSKTNLLIQELAQGAVKEHLDGINLDIENVDPQDRNLFSQFVKALSVQLHKSHLILSLDIPADPKSGNKNVAFDHKVLPQYCDYLVFMGYDQHWSTDPIAGPVTSLSWLTDSINEFIETGIPSNKLILGLPSYTRIWESDQNGKIVKDPALSVSYVENLLNEKHKQLEWNPTLGEYYTSYKENNINYQIWLTNKKSYSTFFTLLSKYHLAGTGFWNLNLMDATYWNETIDLY